MIGYMIKFSAYRIKIIAPLWVVLSVVLVVFLYGTSPDQVGPRGVTFFFLLTYLFLVSTVQLFVLLGARYTSSGDGLKRWKISYALMISSIPVLVIVLGTLGQLLLRDAIILVTLIAMIMFYTIRRGSGSGKT